MKLKFDWFLAGMAVAVGLAWIFPEAGAQGGWLQPQLLNKLGVALIFFLNGMALSEKLLSSSKRVLVYRPCVVVIGSRW